MSRRTTHKFKGLPRCDLAGKRRTLHGRQALVVCPCMRHAVMRFVTLSRIGLDSNHVAAVATRAVMENA